MLQPALTHGAGDGGGVSQTYLRLDRRLSADGMVPDSWFRPSFRYLPVPCPGHIPAPNMHTRHCEGHKAANA
jgi:hypothetical protein